MVHEQVVPEHHEERAVNGMEGGLHGVAHAFRLLLDVNQHLDIRRCVEKRSVQMSTVRVEVPLVLKQAIERFHRRGDDVNALYARLFGFQNEVRQKWNIDQRQRLLRNEGARREHPCAKARRHQERVSNRGHEVAEKAQAFKLSLIHI